MITEGSKVKLIHVYDGTLMGGRPIGKQLTVKEIVDHTPVDGPARKRCIAHFVEDPGWEFIWNLHEVGVE